ncbi:MAG TPA: dihydroorotase [Bacteroidetes bacterium]|nr:dihydroorotase [Bacteroidota bacterium]
MKTESGLFLFYGGLVYNHKSRSFRDKDLVVDAGIIKEIGKIKPESFRGKKVNLQGKHLFPGFVDLHVHLREPGREDKETIETGANAAMAGGFTEICCMPNTNPAIDHRGVVEFINNQAKSHLVAVHPIGAVTKERAGSELAEMGDMMEAGAVAFSDDGASVSTAEMMRFALEYSKMFHVPIIDHCEDLSLATDKKMNEGVVSTSLGIPAVPAVAEDLIVARDLMMAEFTGGHVHIAHISSGRAVELVRQAKTKGISVTAEACPHHFTLTDDAVKSFDTNLRVNPPIRTAADVAEIIAGLKDGTIDAIATDHAPQAIEEKDVEFGLAAPGMVGLETAVGLVTTFLIKKGYLTLPQMAARMSVTPRKIVNLPLPLFKAGEKANFTVIDTETNWTVDKFKFKSKSRNTPFHGWQLAGKSFGVFNRGKWYRNEEN